MSTFPYLSLRILLPFNTFHNIISITERWPFVYLSCETLHWRCSSHYVHNFKVVSKKSTQLEMAWDWSNLIPTKCFKFQNVFKGRHPNLGRRLELRTF